MKHDVRTILLVYLVFNLILKLNKKCAKINILCYYVNHFGHITHFHIYYDFFNSKSELSIASAKKIEIENAKNKCYFVVNLYYIKHLHMLFS